MDYLLKKYCPRLEFDSYEDFVDNFDIKIPENFNFAYDVVDEWAAVEPEKVALVWCNDDGEERTFTFSDIARLSDQCANALTALGVTKGSVVLLVLGQRWEYWVIATALFKIGAVLIPGTTQLTKKDLAYRANAADIEMVICQDNDYVIEQVEAACAEAPSITNTIVVAGQRDGWRIFDELLAEAPTTWERPTGSRATTNDDTLMIYFTSGTTGNPKMVRHNHTHPLGHIITARYWQQVRENTLHLSVSDSGWAKFGWGKIYGQWICGAGVFAYDMASFVPTNLLQKIQDYKLTTFCVPPTMYRFMLQEDVARYDLSSVQNFTTAGEPLNAEVTRQWKELTGHTIREGFGQTESVVLIATWPWVTPRAGSMGKPAALYNIRLLAEDGAYAPDGEEGEICVTGLSKQWPPGLFVGYCHDEERTAQVFSDHRYNLGDVAWCDSDGYYTFVGRNDDVIKCSGYRIGPFEVESALIEHPAVVECAVTGAPDSLRGLVVKATVVLASGWTGDETLTRELQSHVKKTTAPYKYPRIVEFVDELPKTISGKIRRNEIRRASEDAS
ncbi:MAG: AMP-binding protein [Coriobacteriia bacterium]|nr:AMP-binding protein [Coriobacteriia bacterium]